MKYTFNIKDIDKIIIPTPIYVVCRMELRNHIFEFDPFRIYTVLNIEWNKYGNHIILLKELDRHFILDDFMLINFNPN